MHLPDELFVRRVGPFGFISAVLTKPKVVIVLMVLTIGSALIGATVPQVTDMSPASLELWKLKSPGMFYLVDLFQLNRVYTSFWFLFLVFAVLVSLGCSLYSQIRRNLLHSRTGASVGGRTPFCSFLADDSDAFLEEAGKIVEKRGFIKARRHADTGGTAVLFSRYSFSRWGGIVFHAGLFLIILAGVLSLAFQKRGFVQVMEGEVFSGTEADFLVRNSGVFAGRFDTRFITRLNSLAHEYWDTGQIMNLSSEIDLIDRDGSLRKERVEPNRPVRFKGTRIYQSFDYGYTLTFVKRERDGTAVATHFLLDHAVKRSEPLKGKAYFQGTSYTFHMQFYPDVSMRSFALGKPILHLRIERGGEGMFEGLVIPGNTFSAGGDVFHWAAVTPWSGLIYVQGIDTPLAYAGLAALCLGGVLLFFFPNREVIVTSSGSVVSLYAKANKYKPLFLEEMEEIRGEIGEKWEMLPSPRPS